MMKVITQINETYIMQFAVEYYKNSQMHTFRPDYTMNKNKYTSNSPQSYLCTNISIHEIVDIIKKYKLWLFHDKCTVYSV